MPTGSNLHQTFPLPCPGIWDAPMAPRTTFQVGGNARLLLEPTSEEEILEAIRWTREQGMPLFAMGRGSNLVVSDRGFDGAILRLGKPFSGVTFDGNRATALAGTMLTDLVTQCVRKGLGGMEKLAGIPGTVGGAVYIDAGAYGQEFRDCCVAVRSCTREGAIRERSGEECAFGYRTSVFRGNDEVVISATLELQPGDAEELKLSMQEMQRARRDKQPLDKPNAGSFFKRPPGGYASQMVDEAGLRGFRVGNAAISEKHAGFAVNLGGATAQEVWDLSCEVIRRVQAFNGVELEREVVFLGRF